MIMRIWKHIRKYWFYIVCSLIFAALSVASQLYVPILTGNAIDHMIGVGKVDFVGVAAIVRVIVAATAVTAISQWIFGICNNKITYNVSRDLNFPCAIPITTFGIGLIYQKNQCLSSTAQPVSENHQQLSSFSPVNPRSIFPFPLSSENKTQLVYPGE